jgi:hypothetical protein
LVFQADKPEIDLIHSTDVLIQNGAVGVITNRGFIVPALQVVYELIQLIDFGMHDSQIGDEPDFLDIEPAVMVALVRFFIVHSPASDQELRLPLINEMRQSGNGLYPSGCAAIVHS